MKLMRKYYLPCIFLFAPLFINAQVHYADSLFSAGNYVGAKAEYERVIFSGVAPLLMNEILLKKSFCSKAESDFQSAYQTLQRTIEIESQKKTGVAILYESALVSFLQGKSDLTLSHLEEIKYYFPDTTSQMLLILEILALNEQHRWKDAEEKFLSYSTLYSLGFNNNTYSPVLNYSPRKTARAEFLSMLLPGSGQMYAGSFLKGLTSTAINTGLLLFTLYSFSHGFYFSGAFTGVALFYLFYNGGAAFAHDLTEQKNSQVYQTFNDAVKDQLLSAVVLK